MSPAQIWKNYLQAGFSDLSVNDKRKVQFINSFSIVGILSLCTFGFVNIYIGNLIVGILELVLGWISFLNVLLLRKNRKTDFAGYVIVVTMVLILSLMFLSGGVGGTGIYWYYTYPIIVFSLINKRRGWFFIILMILITVHLFGFQQTSYSFVEVTQLLISFFAVSVMVYFLTTIYDDYELDIKKFQLALENASDSVVILDKKLRVIFTNKAHQELSGFSFSEMKGKKIGSAFLWPTLLNENEANSISNLIKHNKDKEFTVKNNTKTGGKYVSQVSVSPFLSQKNGEGFYIAVERDITDLHKVDTMKSEFASLVSHQLRTPLTGIKWLLEMFISGDLGTLSDKQNKVILDLYRENERMIEIINKLLSVAHVESKRDLDSSQKKPVVQVIESVIADCTELLKNKKHTFKRNFDPNLKHLLVDEKTLYDLLNELLKNAILYTANKGTITLVAKQIGKQVYLEVSDNGFGIPDNEKESVYGKFFRGNEIRHKVTDGNGLGLFYVNTLIEQIGGDTGFDSEYGKGSTFWFSFPIEAQT